MLNEKFLEFNNTEVMRSLISLVHSLGLTVIAEGIETQTQVEQLKAAGCDIIQGYYYSVPLGPERIPDVHCKRFS